MAHSDSYSALERRFLGPVRGILLRVYSPIVRFLAWARVTPNTVSASGPALGVLFVLTVPRSPRLAFLIWVLSVVVDGFDGALARYTGRASSLGAFVDQVCDHVRETLTVAGLVAVGAIPPFWGSFYPVVYTALNLVLYMCNQHQVPLPVAVKSWLVLYPAIALFLLTGRSYLNIATPLCVLVMAVVVVQGLIALKPAMDHTGGPG